MPTVITPQQLIDALNWRYATKRFDPTRKFPPMSGMRWSSRSCSRRRRSGCSRGNFIRRGFRDEGPAPDCVIWQAQVGDCSHFVVFTVRRDIDAAHVERHIARMVEITGVAPESSRSFAR